MAGISKGSSIRVGQRMLPWLVSLFIIGGLFLSTAWDADGRLAARISGAAGADGLFGGPGDDVIAGGPSRTYLTGKMALILSTAARAPTLA
jgi:hypothetical protein